MYSRDVVTGDVPLVTDAYHAVSDFVFPTGKVLIVLQENGGTIPFETGLSDEQAEQLSELLDGLAETFEDIKTDLQGAGKYTVVHHLSDQECTRANLLEKLVTHTEAGDVIDLVVLGHGSEENLVLHGESLTGGTDGNIRSLLAEPEAEGIDAFSLRMVYMCNCDGSTLNDDWIAVGADASVGSKQDDWMPEPMTTYFLDNWLDGQAVALAAQKAYQDSIPFYTAIYPPTMTPTYTTRTMTYPCPTRSNPFRTCTKTVSVPTGVSAEQNEKITGSELVVEGNGNLAF